MNRLPELSEKWAPSIGCPTQVGIGVNSGPARVGNIGSRQKFKYGALGNMVNVGARVQQATRRIGVDLLITEATARLVSEKFASRYLGPARLNNISQPIPLYELAPSPDEPWEKSAQAYGESLSKCREGDLHQAAAALTRALAARPQDQPTLLLLSRVVDALRTARGGFDHEWDLSRKPS